MCLSIPAKILSIGDNVAKASVGGSIVEVSLHLVDTVKPGDYVLVHAGFALNKIDEKEALATLALLEDWEDDDVNNDKD